MSKIHTDALLVIDVQLDFIPGGALPVPGGDAIVRPIQSFLSKFETVIATQDWHPFDHVSFASNHAEKKVHDTVLIHGVSQTLWPDHCVQGSPGAAIHPFVNTDAMCLILRKGMRREVDSYSAFRENVGPEDGRRSTGLAELLRARGITRVFLVGLARDFCVRATAFDAREAGFETLVVDDLTESVFPDRRDEVTAAFRAGGIGLCGSSEIGAL